MESCGKKVDILAGEASDEEVEQAAALLTKSASHAHHPLDESEPALGLRAE